MLFWILLTVGAVFVFMGLTAMNSGYWVGWVVGLVLLLFAGLCFWGAYRLHCHKKQTLVYIFTTPSNSGRIFFGKYGRFLNQVV